MNPQKLRVVDVMTTLPASPIFPGTANQENSSDEVLMGDLVKLDQTLAADNTEKTQPVKLIQQPQVQTAQGGGRVVTPQTFYVPSMFGLSPEQLADGQHGVMSLLMGGGSTDTRSNASEASSLSVND